MQPILIDGGQFVAQGLIEIIEDTWVASYIRAPRLMIHVACGSVAIIAVTGEPKRQHPAPASPPPSLRSNNYEWGAALRQHAGSAAVSASSMMRRMVRAHRPHWALQPRQ